MITSSYPKHAGDGTSPFIGYLAESIAAHSGCEIDVVLPEHPELVVDRAGTRARLHPYRYAPTAAWSLWGYAASLDADRAVKSRVFLLAPFALLAGLIRALRITRRRPLDVVHAHWVLPNGPIGALTAWLRGVPLVVSLHGSDMYLAERGPWLGWVARQVFRRASQVVACSENLRDRAIRLGAPARATHTIPYGVDLARFRPDAASRAWLRERLGIGAADPVVLAVGRLVGKKGFEVLVRAWPAVIAARPGARLVIAGDGDLREELGEQARSAGCASSVSFVGAVRHDEIPRFYAGSDVVAIPSVQDEGGNVDGLPNVLMESLASGAAVVATRVGGIPHVVEDGVNGVLVEPHDVAALGAALVRLLADPGMARRLGEAARNGAEEQQGWEATARAHLAVYDDAIGSRSSAAASGPHAETGGETKAAAAAWVRPRST